ncbi:ATP-binding cassette domain-containing protein [Flavobacterium sp. TP390]|uniref:ATP-binding cassette domain-containing protein n=1 Tax=Flavobacterium profundi TaxID=1774945 RepID=A0A6I4IDG0_9FLAO|nr:ABC transporter ATP-binding protein [Flavobacterium profundi]MVO07624.1 ATP-binding cassette domain-containing protein [Flavobacterium profundi]
MLKVSNISFSYTNEPLIKKMSFSLKEGNFLALIGESGCGKSTLLQLIYGLHDLDFGTIFWNDEPVLGPKSNLVPGMSKMKYLAQDFDLMPYTTVAENVGKFLSNFYPEEKKNRVKELLEVVEMTSFSSTKVKFLSGGQMQRVALAKVLALEPELLLLDEPFSHIDNFLKNSLRRKIFAYLKEKQISCIVATHDTQDVLSFCDQVLVMKAGELVDFGQTEEIYKYPSSFYSASLFGEVNQIKWEEDSLFLYAHQLEISENSTFEVVVRKNYFKGNSYLIESTLGNQTIFFENKYGIVPNTTVGLKIKIDL